MNKKALATLEYNKIINTLVSMACSDGAKQTLKALMPMNNIDDINSALDETNDALTRVYQKGSVDFQELRMCAQVSPALRSEALLTHLNFLI